MQPPTQKSITILGVTGSIGSHTVDIIKDNPELFNTTAIVANNNYKKLIQIATRIRPEYVCIINKKFEKEVKEHLFPLKIKVLSGQSGLDEICKIKVDICVCAIMGFDGLSPTIKIIENCSTLAIANKESIVCGGALFIKQCTKFNTKIIPLDSEHNSIYQIIAGEKHGDINKIYLTASGGPFLNRPISEYNHITKNEALNHPNWEMGQKITIDSATLINKGLEIIETYFLFGIDKQKIDVIIHPESIVHAMISFNDGAIKSLLSQPNMRIAISYALGYPDRIPQKNMIFDLKKTFTLNFFPPENNIKHKAITIAKNVLAEEGIMPIALNSANEVFVNSFLENKIKFTDIINNLEKILNKINNRKIESLEHIYEVDKEIRSLSYSLL